MDLATTLFSVQAAPLNMGLLCAIYTVSGLAVDIDVPDWIIAGVVGWRDSRIRMVR